MSDQPRSDSPGSALDAADTWGRVPGLRPPLPASAPLWWFGALAVALSAVVLLLVRPPGPLDQADPAHQRDGLLLSGPTVPAQVAGVSFGQRRVVLVFDRRLRTARALATWAAAVPAAADIRLVLPSADGVVTGPLAGAPRIVVVADPAGALAAAVRLPTPVDGGSGIGYAIVDSRRQVRYSTLDPTYLANGFEAGTIAGSVP